MKYLITIILISFTIAPTNMNRQLFDEFHSVFKKGDFKKMDTLLTNDFIGLDKNGQ